MIAPPSSKPQAQSTKSPKQSVPGSTVIPVSVQQLHLEIVALKQEASMSVGESRLTLSLSIGLERGSSGSSSSEA